ncbi:MAG: CbtA family protein [Mycobacterium sp.]
MEKRIIWRGILAGASAGVLAFVFARALLEPAVVRAIDYGSGRGKAESALTGVHEHDMEVFTRDIQANVGMGFGVLAFAVAMGALFAVAFIVSYSRFAHARSKTTLGPVAPRAQALVLAASAFVVVYLVPFLKYPANPPSIGNPDTIGKRTGLYLLVIGLSLVAAVAAAWLGRRLCGKLGAWGATLSGVGAYIAVMTVVMLLLPAVSEVPQPLRNDQGGIVYPGFSADDLFHFRIYAVGTQFIIWATIGLVFGTLVSQLLVANEKEMLPA